MMKRKYEAPVAKTTRTRLRASLLAASTVNVPLTDAQIKAGVADDSPTVNGSPVYSFD